MTPDYYALLNVVRDADPEIVRAAYLVLVKRYHPDVAAVSPHSVEKFQLITEAYEWNLAQREKFESARRRSTEPAQRKQGERSQEEQVDREAGAGEQIGEHLT